jgi:hypothetical protein
MFCPACRAEYVQGVEVCSDCQVALVYDLPGEPEAPQDVYFVRLWQGGDPHRKSEVCAALERGGIPFRENRREDPFITANFAGFEVYVPNTRLAEAKDLVGEDETTREEWERAEELVQAGAFELSAEEADDYPEMPERAEEWLPEDASAEIWAGNDASLASGIRACLKELHIPCRTDPPEEPSDDSDDVTAQKIFVLPEDAERAREIVREIVEAAPPQ